MKDLAIRKTVAGNLDAIAEKVIEAIKPAGFGVLTRIDFDQKIKEKLNENIPRTIILGACNPKLAYEAYKQTTDIALLVPCNIVVRELPDRQIAIEAIRPSAMLGFLPSVQAAETIREVESQLEAALQKI